MIYCKDFSEFRLQAINNAIVAENEFAYNRVLDFGNYSTKFWKPLEPFDGSDHVQDKQARIMAGI